MNDIQSNLDQALDSLADVGSGYKQIELRPEITQVEPLRINSLIWPVKESNLNKERE